MFDEFVDFAEGHGLSIPYPNETNKICRFATGVKQNNKSGWFIVFKNESVKSGKHYIYGQCGDWTLGSRHTYQTKGVHLTNEEKQQIKTDIAEAQERVRKEREKVNEEAAQVAEKWWKEADENFSSEYFTRKGIDQLYGTRTRLEERGRAILVPCRDETGKLWGIQRIFENGDKLFQAGQRIKGCYHTIGETSAHVYLCEGFATGVSIHRATGHRVICAFSANNLKTVALAYAKSNPSIAITIAGDDDAYTTDSKGEPKNTGREAAEEAAKAIGARAVFPVFDKPEKGKTDFNDMDKESGIVAIKENLRDKKSPGHYVALGSDEGTHFFYILKNGTIAKTTMFTPVDLMQLRPLEVWKSLFQKGDYGVNWEEAKDSLIKESQSKGIFNPARIRGTGVWIDRQRTIVNTGEFLYCNGIPTDMLSLDTKFIYVNTKNTMEPLHQDPLTAEEGKILDKLTRSLAWDGGELSGVMLSGWIAIARIAGALPIRPHAWLTGSSGSGKSTIMAKIIDPCLGTDGGKIYLVGKSSEAGIRASVKSDSLPVIYDEFETTDARTQARIEDSIELLRQTWSATSGQLVKGSPSGSAINYTLNFSALVSSIRPVLSNEADKSRFAMLELSKPIPPAQWRKLSDVIHQHINPEYGERLFSRMVKRVDYVLQDYETFQRAVADKVTQRAGQQYGMLLAGWWGLTHDKPATIEEADAIAEKFCTTKREDIVSTEESLECFEQLLTTRVEVNTPNRGIRRFQVGKIISKLHGFWGDLSEYGIYVVDRDKLFLKTSDRTFKNTFYKNCLWEKNFKTILLRLHDDVKSNQFRINGSKLRGVMVPLKLIGLEIGDNETAEVD